MSRSNIIQSKRTRLILMTLLLISAISFYYSLPEPLFKSPVSSILLSEDEKLLGAHIAKDGQWRFPPIKKVPAKFTKSIIAFEDKRFYQHHGIDPLAIARALKLNLKAGRIVSGGSTISMQVIRLASHNPRRTLLQKTLEAFKALRLETRYSKAEILQLYASHAPFGGNVVGLEAASWRYFGRTPEQLSWAESAMLAVLPNSPALIHPGRARNRLKSKRDWLLQKLYKRNALSKLDYQLAIAEPLPEKPKDLPRLAPHLLDTLSQDASTSKQHQRRFTTTLDRSIQQKSNLVAKHHAETLALKNIHNLAILVLDNHSFKVKAYVGNVPLDNAKPAHGQAIDLIRRPRSTGSTLKPLLFARMLDAGEITPEMLIADTPVRYSGYRPKNFDRDYRGAVRAKQALASSLNVPAVNMLSYHGIERFLASLKQMGMSTLHRRSREYGLPLILGGAEGTLWELTSLYANLAKRAQQSATGSAQTKIQRQHYMQPVVVNGKSNVSKRRREVSPAAAWSTLQALLEVSRPGNEAYWKRFDSTHKIAWKTGTSFGHRDAWAIGTTPKYTVGVWVGNAAGEGRQGMTGVKVAAPIMFDIFNRLPLTQTWFRKPVEQMKRVSLCKNDGYLANALCEPMDYYIPLNSHFDRVTPHQQKVHLDANNNGVKKRVHGACESVSNMQHQNWFVLPPDQAVFYRQSHPGYQPLPTWRNDCKVQQMAKSTGSPISLIYPRKNTQIYIPRELAGQRGKTVFQAVHGNPETQLFWHLNNRFLGTTKTYHEQAIRIAAGNHTLTLVDEHGNSLKQNFQVLSQ